MSGASDSARDNALILRRDVRGIVAAIRRDMPNFHVLFDSLNGAEYAVAKQGGRIPLAELEAMRAEARAGDGVAAVALRAFDFALDDLGRELPIAEQHAALLASFAECPECNEARARGETPCWLGIPESLIAQVTAPYRLVEPRPQVVPPRQKARAGGRRRRG